MNARIQVGIRFRPFLEYEIGKGYQNTKLKVDKSQGKINVHDGHSNSNRVFEFDHIFEQSSTQRQIYEECKVNEMVARVLDGFHSTIFAYGQTGSGKTYTMEGKHDNGIYVSEDMKGIVANVFDDLFSMIAKLKTTNNKVYNVTCSFLQIYNEKIYDLLSHNSQFAKNFDQNAQPSHNQQASAAYAPQSLKLRWNAREQFQVENLFVFDIKNSRDAQNYFLQGVKNRITASHKLNMTSSRSHTIFTITVHSFSEQGAHETSSKLQLVDLAGSERISLTGTEGKMAKESIDINKSLFTLRQVITALSEINQSNGNTNSFNLQTPSGNQMNSTQANFQLLSTQQIDQNTKIQHIPYRESKLTSLLKQSIGGNCYCLMMACIVPNDSFNDENISTLHYASRATYIRNQPIKNEDPNKQLLSEVNKQNDNLKSELEKAHSHITFLTAALEKSEKNNSLLKQQNSSLIKQLENRQFSTGQQNYGNDSKDAIQSLASQTSTSFQSGKQSEQLTKEQIFFQQQQEQFKIHQQQQLYHQKQLEQFILMKQQMNNENKPNFNEQDYDNNNKNSNLNQPQNFDTQSQNSSQNNQGFKQNTNNAHFIRHNIVDTPNCQAQAKQQLNNNGNLQSQGENKLYYTQMDYDNFSDRLIESITLVRQLLQNNKELRQQTDEYKLRANNCEYELSDLTKENQDLKEQLEILLSQKGQKYSSKSSKRSKRPQSQMNFSQEELNEQNEDGENHQIDEQDDQYYISPQEGDLDKNSKSNIGNIPPKYPKKKKTESNTVDDQEIQDIKELVLEENLDTQQGDTNISILQQKKQIGQAIRGKNTQSNDVNNNAVFQNQTKNDLISEILELRHNQQVLEKKIKSYDIDKSNTKQNSQGLYSITNNNIMNSGNLPANSAGKNQTTNQNSKQVYTFYSGTKKRGSSQHQSSQKQNNSYNQQNLSMQLQDEYAPGQSLNATALTGTSTSTTKGTNLNRTQQDFNAGNYVHSTTVSASQNPNNVSDSNNVSSTINTTVYTNRQGIDSAPTNFGRYTFYQQNFNNLEKMSQQQMIKFQQPQNQSLASSSQINQAENYKFLSTGRNTLSNIGTQLYQDYFNEQQQLQNELNQPSSKRMAGSGIPSIKTKRSNSLTKQQINMVQTTSNSNNPNQKPSIVFEFYQGNQAAGVQNQNMNNGVPYNKLKNMYGNGNNLQQVNNTFSNDENATKTKYTTQIDSNSNGKQKQKVVLSQQRKLSISNN